MNMMLRISQTAAIVLTSILIILTVDSVSPVLEGPWTHQNLERFQGSGRIRKERTNEEGKIKRRGKGSRQRRQPKRFSFPQLPEERLEQTRKKHLRISWSTADLIPHLRVDANPCMETNSCIILSRLIMIVTI